MNKINYQQKLDEIIENNKKAGITPSLLLHVCCAPCASYCLEYLSPHFDITVIYYNPNITNEEEYLHRKSEVLRLIDMYDGKVKYLDTPYEKPKFEMMSKGLELCKEGGQRCLACYGLRLNYTAKIAEEKGFDYFCSSLSISPHKNSQILNQIGEVAGLKHNVKHLPNDFKKKNGYKRSCELSQLYGFYRQDYCGCDFSKEERESYKQ